MRAATLDEAFANDVRGALEAKQQAKLAPLLFLVAGFLGLFLAWAAIAELEEVTTGTGRIIPSSQMQLVQPFEAGIVRQIAVAEGDIVDAGDVLLVMDDTEARSALGELIERHQSLSMQRLRLSAEAQGEVPDFPSDVSADITESERLLYEARQLALIQETGVVNEQLQQRTFELAELRVRIEETEVSIGFVERELELTRRLHERNAIPEMDLVRRESTAAEQQRELAVMRASVPRSEAAVEESRRQLANIDIQFRADARQQLSAVIAELAVIEQSLAAARERVVRTELRAPVRGVVNALPVTTLGAVIRPAESVVEIVPVDDTLLVEAEVRPQDIAFISPGQDASVKLTAYNYTVYGDLTGTVERISADTFEDEQGETFYRIIVRLEDNPTLNGDVPVEIIPGMVVSVDILTGSKTILEYILNPITRARNEAMRER